MCTKSVSESDGFLVTSVSDTVTVASYPGSVISVEVTDDEDLSSGGRDLSSDLCISVTWGEYWHLFGLLVKYHQESYILF